MEVVQQAHRELLMEAPTKKSKTQNKRVPVPKREGAQLHVYWRYYQPQCYPRHHNKSKSWYPYMWITEQRNWDFSACAGTLIFCQYLQDAYNMSLQYDAMMYGTDPNYPRHGPVRWRELCLRCTTSSKHASNDMQNACSITSTAEDGEILPSNCRSCHEFGLHSGVYVNPLTDPGTTDHKVGAYNYGTFCCIFPEGAPKWDIEYTNSETRNEEPEARIPLVKFVWTLEETVQGRQNRIQSHSKKDADWAWCYPKQNDLHLSKLRVLIGIPPPPEAFRYCGFWVDPTDSSYLKSMQPMIYSHEGCLC